MLHICRHPILIRIHQLPLQHWHWACCPPLALSLLAGGMRAPPEARMGTSCTTVNTFNIRIYAAHL